MGDDTAGNERLDAAFAGWIEAQQAALETMRSAPGVPRTDVDVAEGYRWVTRLASLAQDWFLEKSDPLHPQLFQLQDEYRKLLVDNPDVRYLFAVLDDHHSYRLTGTRGEAAYVGLTFGTPIGKGAVGGRTGTTTQVHLDEFELGPGRRGRHPDRAGRPAARSPAGQLDRARARHRPGGVPRDVLRQAPRASVRPAHRAGGRGAAADARCGRPRHQARVRRPVPAVRGGHRGEHVGTTPTHNINSFGGTAGAVHVEAQDDEVRSHSDADMTYHGGRWVLGEDEALVITVHEPDRAFLYWGLTIASPWMESYDYRYTTTNLNNRRGRAVGRRDVAAGHLADRSGRGQLARHRGAPRGLHDRALGAGRRSAPPDLRARAPSGDRQEP